QDAPVASHVEIVERPADEPRAPAAVGVHARLVELVMAAVADQPSALDHREPALAVPAVQLAEVAHAPHIGRRERVDIDAGPEPERLILRPALAVEPVEAEATDPDVVGGEDLERQVRLPQERAVGRQLASVPAKRDALVADDPDRI